MDDAEIDSAETDLIAWGILERAPDLQMTRRFRGGLMRAAAKLQEEERAGARPSGHPIEVTVLAALRAYPLPPGAQTRRIHEILLVGLHVASLPEAVRAVLGV